MTLKPVRVVGYYVRVCVCVVRGAVSIADIIFIIIINYYYYY
jgi:hypothetical protein